jgi:hypothetical protein
MAKSKSSNEIKKEYENKKKAGEAASQEALKIADFAEQRKRVFENMKGDATSETAVEVAVGSDMFQKNLESRSNQETRKAETISKDLEKDQQKLEGAASSDAEDIKQLKMLQTEAKNVGISGTEGIAKAEEAKKKEIAFLNEENRNIEKSQIEMDKKINDANQKLKNSQSKYQSRPTL